MAVNIVMFLNMFIPRYEESDIISILLGLMTLLGFALYHLKRRRLVSLIGKIPGLPDVPFIGNTIEVNVDHDELFTRIVSTRMLWGKSSGLCKAWFGPDPYIFVSKASAVEAILSSSEHTEKSKEYSYLHPWLGTGLLTSSGTKWQTRRKILTPSFHFRILEDFLCTFVEQSDILCEKLEEQINKKFDVFPYIARCTLDIICETAMGRKVNAQNDLESAYVKAVNKIGTIVQNRQAKIWLQPSWAFRCSSLYKQHQNCLKVLHNFSNKVIQDKKDDMAKKSVNDNNMEENFGAKKRLAFLDLLLQAAQNGAELSDEDIREEVDTFMFEGHDTTSAAICWLLYLLGCHPEIQDQVFDELDYIFSDSDRHPTSKDLYEMKYLECCIKEALRLFPSVPIFARKIKSDVKMENYVVPKGTTAMIVAYQLHRDPIQFQDPEIFKPERFAARYSGRHPYSYIPFSAGPRNCIGQKFAVMEEKVVVSSILRKFKITSIDRRENLILLGELVLRPKNGFNISITRRK